MTNPIFYVVAFDRATGRYGELDVQIGGESFLPDLPSFIAWLATADDDYYDSLGPVFISATSRS